MKKKILIFALSLSLVFPLTVRAESENVSQSEIEAYTVEIGKKYNICPELIQAIIERESSYDPSATNGSCIGLMQVSEKWHKDRMKRLGITDLYDPYSNILVGTDYLAELFNEAIESDRGDDLYYVLMRYNLKTDTANKRWDNGDYSTYAIEIAERSAELEEEHGKGDINENFKDKD